MFRNINPTASISVETYRLRLQGALNSPAIDWLGIITIVPQEQGEILQVSLLLYPAALRSFLDQFQNLNITVVPNEYIKIENLQAVDA